jgi:hypothetical protein
MKIKLESFDKYDINGEFKYTIGGDTIIFNTESNSYGGILFLTPNAPLNTGITLYRSKNTNKMTISENEEQLVFKNGNKDSTEFEPVDIIGNVYNRLVIFNTKILHAITHNFGNNLTNGRLVQTFAFDINSTSD